MDSKICQYDLRGFCKNFKKVDCPNGAHFQETCQNGPICTDRACQTEKRHPKSCRYLKKFGFCKLGDQCRYSHFSILDTIFELKDMISRFFDQLQEIRSEINSTKKSTKKSTNLIKDFTCEFCGQNFVSKGGKTRHINAKHGSQKIPTLETFDLEKTKKGENDLNPNTNFQKDNFSSDDDRKIDEKDHDLTKDKDFESSEFSTTCIDQPDKIKKKQQIAFLVNEKLRNYEQRVNQISEEEENYIKIPKMYTDITTNESFEYDDLRHITYSKNEKNLTIFLNFEKFDPKDHFYETTNFGTIKSEPECGPEPELDNDDTVLEDEHEVTEKCKNNAERGPEGEFYNADDENEEGSSNRQVEFTGIYDIYEN